MSNNGSDRRSAAQRIHRRPDNVLFEAWLVSRSVHDLIDTAIEASGLDADEFAIYSVLASGDGLTPSDLASWMAAASTTVSSYVKRFERRGHIMRTPNPEDGRSYRLELTPAGHEAHRHAGELFAPILSDTEEALGEQAEAVHSRLLELLDAVDTTRAEHTSRL